jgi:hypothetical protein
MALSDRIANYEAPRIGAACRTCALLKSLPEKEAEALRVALADKRFSNGGLSRILRDEGYKIAESTLRRHRKGECAQS